MLESVCVEVLGTRRATAEILGSRQLWQIRITEKVGAGLVAKWQVRWDKLDLNSETIHKQYGVYQ